ncbi:MAG TPA: tRNA (guanosine(46)-N7)-methyltransferase TrmB [Thermodesulfobacteriota bacterium]|nr:tRNA (guanosine(46)-N7)-methyltransferase TrmB [Thermodesulfobacteriota bacterium]
MNSLSPMLDITEHYLPLDMSEVFGNKGEAALEIGCGEGDFLIEMAKRKSHWNFTGIEIKRKRFKKAIKNAERERLQNLRFLHMDAKIAVEEVFSPNTFSEVYINFPDPWPKDRHKKHRIINPEFLERLYKIMKRQAVLEIASDHEEYISHILGTFSETGIFESMLPPPGYVYNLPNRPPTKFEREFREEGKEIYYLRFMRIAKVKSTVT